MVAAYSLMKGRKFNSPPGTVTAELKVRFLRPTPIDKRLRLKASSTRIENDRVWVEGSVEVDGVQTVAMQGLYIALRTEPPPARFGPESSPPINVSRMSRAIAKQEVELMLLRGAASFFCERRWRISPVHLLA